MTIPEEIDELSKYVIENTGDILDPQEKGEISIKQFADHSGLSYRVAGRRLDQMVVKGKMTKRLAKDDNNNIVVYKKVVK